MPSLLSDAQLTKIRKGLRHIANTKWLPYEDRMLLLDAAEAIESCARLRRALQDLISSHDGYRHGLGPCICAAHEQAREVLAALSVRDDGPQTAEKTEETDKAL